MIVRDYKTGNKLGFLSIILAAIAIVFILVPDLPVPQNNLTGYIVICGGGGASWLSAIGAGLIGSRRWFLALLGPVIVASLVLFNP